MDANLSESFQLENISEKLNKYDSRAVQTLFRTVYRNHYNLLKMVDNKARIVLTINSIITSLLLGLLLLVPEERTSDLGISVRILVIFSMLSMVFALISMLPCRYFGKIYQESGYKGTLYAQSFSKLTLTEFKNEFARIMEKGKNTYDEIITDLYFLGKCISYKQRLLYLSATVFLIGLATTITYTLTHGLVQF